MTLYIPSTVAKGMRNFTLALRSLWLHKLRAFLSVLGIIIGTGAVIALMGVGEGSMHDALEDIKRQGATNIIVRSVKPPEDGAATTRSFVASYGLTTLDYEYIRTMPTIVRHVPLRVFKQEVRYLGHSTDGRIVGTTPRYKEVHKFEIVSGRFLTDEEEEKMENHAVLGSDLAAQLFPFEDPLGKAVVIDKYHYRIIGVLGSRMPTGGTGGSQSAEEFNNDIYIPLSTCNVRFGSVVFLRQTGSRAGP
jgi:putative ABC transport system permease protein